MVRAEDVRGVIPAIVTPFGENGELDGKALEMITEYLIENGVDAIMAVGGTGEFPHLLREEKREVVATVAGIAKGKVPVIAGTAACSTREAILLSQDAHEVGASAVIVTAPYYFKLPEDFVIKHFETIAENIDCPLVVYNNPLYTGNNVTPSGLVWLLKEKNIIGLKQSNSDMGQLVEVIRLSPEGVSICTGIDSQFYPALCIGAKGVYSTAASVIPAQIVRLYRLFKERKYDEALELHIKLQKLNKYLEYDPGYVAPAKEVLKMIGLTGGALRAPIPELTEEERKEIKEALKEIGVI